MVCHHHEIETKCKHKYESEQEGVIAVISFEVNMLIVFHNYSGLVTLDQMRAKQEDIVKEREKQIALKRGEAARLEDDQKGSGKRKMKSKQVNC